MEPRSERDVPAVPPQTRRTLSPDETAFEARGLTRRFGRFTALSEVNLRVSAGEVFTLFGRNGAGKTTFLHLAATLMKPTSGGLFYGGKGMADDPTAVRRRIGLVSHTSLLYSDLTARENLDLYARLYGLEDRTEAVRQGLDRADLTLRADSPVRSLSRGMQQRLSIARALLHRPSLLLLDEPYTGLDPISSERFSRQIRGLRDAGAAVVLTTHDLEQGLEVADRVGILESGRMVYEGEGKQSPVEFRKIFTEVTGMGSR